MNVFRLQFSVKGSGKAFILSCVKNLQGHRCSVIFLIQYCHSGEGQGAETISLFSKLAETSLTIMPDHRKPKTANRKLSICVPVVEANTNRARSKYLRAARKGLWTELRLDFLAQPDLKRLFRSHPGPVIATNRLAAEGGRWSGREAERRALLEEALALGADFLDLELAADPAWRRELTQRRGEAKIILSWHDFSGTPDLQAWKPPSKKCWRRRPTSLKWWPWPGNRKTICGSSP